MKALPFIISLFILVAFQPKQPAKNQIERGKTLSKSCTNCHLVSRDFVGPPLKNIRQIRTKDWIYRYTQNPAKFVNENKQAKDLFKKYKSMMSGFNITKKDIDAILDYFDSLPDDPKK